MNLGPNILFIRLRLLGDIIFTIPALQLYRRRFPENQIYYVVEEKFSEMASLIPGIRQVIVVPRKMGFRDLYRFRKKIKSLHIDTVVDFHSGPKAALLTFLSGAGTRIGYRTPNRNWAYNRLTPRNSQDGFSHSVYNQARLLEHLGVDITKILPYPEIKISPHQVSGEIKEWLETAHPPRIIIHVGAGNKFRDWGIDNFAALIEKLEKRGAAVALVGHSPGERQKGELMAARYPVRNFTGRLSIKDVLYLIERSDLYFGVDSGPLHLASLTKTPIICIYGPNIPDISGPWRRERVEIIQLNMACRPCSQRGCIYDTIKCMNNITPEGVYETIVRYIQ